MKAFQLFLVPLIINLVNPANTIANWDWQNPLPQGNTLCCSFFINENTGWAAGELGVILKTVNGGPFSGVIYGTEELIARAGTDAARLALPAGVIEEQPGLVGMLLPAGLYVLLPP